MPSVSHTNPRVSAPDSRPRRCSGVPAGNRDAAASDTRPRIPSWQHGYTLIELMIVVSIIGILASIAQPSFQQYRIRAKETSLKRSLFVMRDVIDQYYADHGQYPDDLAGLVSGNYIRALPADPFTRSSDTWIVSPPPEGEKGAVFDVHSGSDLVSLDGMPYNDW